MRTGKRALIERDEEIALARSAAPSSVSGTATVLVLSDTGYAVAAVGTNGVTCLVNRSWLHSLEPHCYDGEATRTMLPIERHRLAMRQLGRPEDEIATDIARRLADGRFTLPIRPAMSYMMSAEQVLYGDDGKRAGAWLPHVMIYYPYLTAAAVGFGAAPDMRLGMVSEAGTAEANLMLIMPAPVKVVRKPTR